MEFPHNALTNVHKIDDVHSIYWETFSTGTGPGPPNTKGPSTPAVSPKTDTFAKATDVLYGAQRDLRRSRHHVFYDKEQSSLWVFWLSAANTADSAAHDEGAGVGDIIRCHGLKKTDFGSLRAVDLISGQATAGESKPGVATAQTLATVPAHKQIAQLKASHDRGIANDGGASNIQARADDVSDKTAQHIRIVYSNFVYATFLSISYLLAEREAYIPVGSLLIEGSVALDRQDDFGLEGDEIEAKAVVLNVHWAPSGSLVLSASPRIPSGLRKVSASITDTLDTSDSFHGSEIRLAPSSQLAILREIEAHSDADSPSIDEAMAAFDGGRTLNHRHLRRKKWKAHVRNCLAARGISISDQGRWIHARLTGLHEIADGASDTGVRLHSEEPVIILWPAELCFFHERSGESSTTDYAAWFFRPVDDIFHDPLLDAEKWFTAKGEREATKEAKHREKELLARNKETLSTYDGEEDTSDTYARTNQYVDMQAINGVYPTPPDGFQPQAIGGSTTNDPRPSPAAQEVGAVVADTSQDTQVAQTPTAMPSGFGLGTGNYDAHDDEDLFGDMDTETFATNGLTEADFSFFDEPDVYTMEVEGDKHLNGQARDTDLHADLNAVEPMAISGTTPDLTVVKDDGINQPVLDNDASSSNGLPREISEGQTNVAKALSPPQSPGNMDKTIPLGFEASSVLDESLATQMGVVEAGRAAESVLDRHQRSLFDPVTLSHSAQIYDTKYGDHGRYNFKASPPPPDRNAKKQASRRMSSIPRLGLPPRCRCDGSVQEDSGNATSGHTLSRPPGNAGVRWEAASIDSDVTEDEELCLDLHTDLNIESPGTAETPSRSTLHSRKRKREVDYSEDLVMTPSLRTGYASDASDDGLSYPEPGTLVLNLVQDLAVPTSDLFLAANRRLKAPSTNIETLNGYDYIQLAQILADQLASRGVTRTATVDSPANFRPQAMDYATSGKEPLAHVISTLFPNSKQCDLKDYTEIGVQAPEVPVTAKPAARLDQRRQTVSSHGPLKASALHSIFKVQVPYMRVQRTAKSMEILPSAYPFWETLGIGPCHGPKDISAYCIYLAKDGAQRNVENFLDMLGSVYDGCKLGTHKRGTNSGGPADGLVPVSMVFEGQEGATRPVPEDFIQLVESVCEDLGKALARNPTQRQNLVVYILDIFGESRALPELCAAFLGMFQAYVSAPQIQQLENPSDLVLQIVPEGFITSKETIAMPLPAEYRKLAFEVYDRCVPDTSERKDGMLNSAPVVQLADTLPRTIEFSLTSEPASSLLHTDRCLHIAYSYRSGNGWLSAAWTDSLGAQQWSASYGLCRGTNDARRSFSEVAKEIWETTVEIVRARKVARRILIVKDGAMPPEEAQTWTSLAAQTVELSPLLLLLSIDAHPPLSFPLPRPTSMTSAIGGSDSQSGLYASPISSPQTGALSPELSGHAATPGGGSGAPTTSADQHFDTDINARLIDTTDETWGVILAQPLNSAASLFEYRPALASGYLIKRAGAQDGDGLVAMGVDLVHAPKPYHVQLKEVLTMFHGLGVLARIRGLVDPVRGVLPWHMAAAINARSGLDRML